MNHGKTSLLRSNCTIVHKIRHRPFCAREFPAARRTHRLNPPIRGTRFESVYNAYRIDPVSARHRLVGGPARNGIAIDSEGSVHMAEVSYTALGSTLEPPRERERGHQHAIVVQSIGIADTVDSSRCHQRRINHSLSGNQGLQTG